MLSRENHVFPFFVEKGTDPDAGMDLTADSITARATVYVKKKFDFDAPLYDGASQITDDVYCWQSAVAGDDLLEKAIQLVREGLECGLSEKSAPSKGIFKTRAPRKTRNGLQNA